MKVRIDRFEESFAVCVDEEETFYDLPRADFSIPLHEGDILDIELQNGKVVSARFLEEETKAEAEAVRALMRSLRRKK